MNHLERILLWLIGGGLSTAALAWVAFQIQQEQIAPALLFPLAVGMALGGLLLMVRRYSHSPRRWAAIGTALAWGLLLVVAQDYIGHRVRLGQFQAEISGGHPLAVALAGERDMRPTFAQHVGSRFRGQPLWWTLDLVLTAAAAAAVMAIGTRPPAMAAETPPTA